MTMILKNCRILDVESGAITEAAITVANDEIVSIDRVVGQDGGLQVIDMQGA